MQCISWIQSTGGLTITVAFVFAFVDHNFDFGVASRLLPRHGDGSSQKNHQLDAKLQRTEHIAQAATSQPDSVTIHSEC